ncbi:MAG: hypothetical protein WC788_03785 [Candidatus Paceibacterota bacterium]|jgi:hypothetical protein
MNQDQKYKQQQKEIAERQEKDRFELKKELEEIGRGRIFYR